MVEMKITLDDSGNIEVTGDLSNKVVLRYAGNGQGRGGHIPPAQQRVKIVAGLPAVKGGSN